MFPRRLLCVFLYHYLRQIVGHVQESSRQETTISFRSRATIYYPSDTILIIIRRAPNRVPNTCLRSQRLGIALLFTYLDKQLAEAGSSNSRLPALCES